MAPQPHVGTIIVRAMVMYGLIVVFLIASVAIHEQSHYVAAKGFDVPPVAVYDDEAAARADLVGTGRLDDGPVIVFYPNTLFQALTLGLLPAVPDGQGVLAATYIQDDDADWATIEAAPVWISLGLFVFSLALVIVWPSLLARAAHFASAIAIGNTNHHMAAAGVGPAAATLITILAVVIATTLMIVRGRTVRALLAQRRARPPRTPEQVRPRPNRLVCRKRERHGLN